MADDPQPKEEAAVPGGGYQFGTFKGVFTPSILTILGVVMYLRFGWVLGNVGLAGTLLIVTMATAITFLTGLSLSALATNMRVGGGGAYYIISRSLGLEAGAAVGLPLFIAQALGISFYIAGFSESVVDVVQTYNGPELDPQLIGVVTLLVLTAVAYKSADLALKTQFLVMILIGASLVSFFLGDRPGAPPPTEVPAAADFWVVFAVFFPAVTGIEAGIAMSGDLKDPAKALPRGTIAAIAVGYLVYMAIPVFLYHLLQDPERLLTNMMIMRDVSAMGELIVLGIWAASLSSAMGALLGAPRTLQALAVDRVIPQVLGRGFGKGNDPRIATGIAFAVGLIGIIAGDLNVIAPVLAMFFLTSYGLLNISAGLEELISPPSWRPRFRVHCVISLVGAFGCFATMFMINAGATFLAMFVSCGVYYYMKRRSMRASWGDMRSGIFMLIIRYAIHALAQRQLDERTWRPNLLVLSGSPTTRWYMIELADAISQDRGLLTIATVVPDDTPAERQEKLRSTITTYLQKREVTALVKVHADESHLIGMQALVKTYGFGPITPNTILLGDTQQTENYVEYSRLIRLIHRRKQNLVIIREQEELSQFIEGARIDLWATNNPQNRGLMLSLAYLLNRSRGWRQSTLFIKTIVESEADREQAQQNMNEFVEVSRLDAEPEVIVKQQEGIFATISAHSQGADVVFLGIRAPSLDESPEAYSQYYAQLLAQTDKLPPTALVLAAEEIDFSAIFEER